MKSLSLYLVTIMMMFFVNAFAQDDAKTSAASVDPSGLIKVSKKDKKTMLNFEDELIEGQTQKPELFYLFQKKNFNYNKLIKLRENFIPEMRKTTEDVQRVRGGN